MGRYQTDSLHKNGNMIGLRYQILPLINTNMSGQIPAQVCTSDNTQNCIVDVGALKIVPH